jgi:Photosynthesis affected mutant 68
MSSQPKPDSPKDASSRNPLPFEPIKSRKKPEKKPAAIAPDTSEKDSVAKKDSPAKKDNPAKKDSKTQAKGNQNSRVQRADLAIPDVVSRRMARRMALFCGIPSILGLSTFFVSYLVVTHNLLSLPNAAVVLVSMGFFGLGVLGLSYGVISASWDEEDPGSKLGWSEFKTNLGRLTEAWRSARNKS